ncbi:phosphate regulon sensor histidine kinase PhoR [Marinomonas piezotolerans]|uniref:Phosphate regulon sensor protein PhoR n=1 Tax=Marinomonas piezotolerans TaxID=2213058 RepID=A0A370UAQ0_9GAMM|nr:phosphate regulon sensor histidine kinase PhoR [Marinomonas piezotolerans]RDL44876.1 phosphate regulon sensor histidine kinase PhoR [Marinomonas piezotolerans]
MKQTWRQAILTWVSGLAAVLVIGFVIDRILATTLLYTLGTLYWQLYQLYKFQAWLRRSGKSAPPEASGIWGEVFDSVYRLQKKQRKSKRRMRQALNRIENSTAALKEGVIMADSNGNLEWWNNSAGLLLGLMRPVDRGQPITNILRNPEFFRYFSQKRFGEPLVIKSPSKEGVYLEVQTTLYDQNDHLIFIRDVTRLYLLEQMRKDFVANASHELKTPLTVIKGYLETLSMFKDSLPASMQRGIVSMTDQSQRMEHLIEDLLLLSRLETNEKREEHQWHSIQDVLETIERTVKPIISENHTLTVSVPNDSYLYGAHSELYSAFSNLIVNAIKYSPNGGQISVIWENNEHSGVFSVADQGLGIDPRFIPRLTERFFRVDKGRGSSTGGTGLGLAIVKHVLIHHNAKLQISSQPNIGSTFSCHFPIDRVRQDAMLASVAANNQEPETIDSQSSTKEVISR